MIKLKSILKENHILITEKFAAGKLRALTNHWQGGEAQFFMWGAKLGVEWDKITDSEIETNAKPKKKGIEIAYVDKEVTVPTKGKKGYWWGCTGYPDCKTTAFDEKGRPKFLSPSLA